MGRQSDEVYARLRKQCGHPPERRVHKPGNSPGATQCLDCRSERDKRTRASKTKTRMEQLQELGLDPYASQRRTCEHAPEHKRQRYKRNGTKDGFNCLACIAERQREKVKQTKKARELKVNDTGTPPSDEVLRGALCGDTADNRFIMLPNLLSEDDEDELNRWCSGCPVRMGCFEWATVNRHFIGVAGGHTFGFNKQGRRVTKPLRAKEAVA